MGISMAGVFVDRLDRENLFDALYERRCYGVTGERIQLAVSAFPADVPDAAVQMGQTLSGSQGSDICLSVQVLATAPVSSIDLISNGQVAASANMGETQVGDITFSILSKDLLSYYYVRVIQSDGHMAWSSPIWFDKGG